MKEEKVAQASFIDACDKFLGKNSADIQAHEMVWLFRLYTTMQGNSHHSLTHKLLTKLQRQILSLYSKE